jgi:hypothetical protein
MADPTLLALGALVCLLGAVFGGIALKVQREHRRWCARAMQTDGVVSRLAERRSQGLSEDASGVPTGPAVTRVAVVRFRVDGIDYEIDAPEAPLEIGSAVRVAYEPGKPSGARAVQRVPKVGCAVVLLVLGAALVVLELSR